MPSAAKSARSPGPRNKRQLMSLITAYLNDHPRPRAEECAWACGSDVSLVRETARRVRVPLASDFDQRRDKELLDRFELVDARKSIDRRVVNSHEELLLRFREFAHARGIPWRVAMTQAVEGWMILNRRRPTLKRELQGLLACVLVPENIHEGAQLALQRMRG